MVVMHGRVEIFLGAGYRRGEPGYHEAMRAIGDANRQCHISIGAVHNHPQEKPGAAERMFGCDIAYYEFMGSEEYGLDSRAQELVDAINKNKGVCAKLVLIEPNSSNEIHRKDLERVLGSRVA